MDTTTQIIWQKSKWKVCTNVTSDKLRRTFALENAISASTIDVVDILTIESADLTFRDKNASRESAWQQK